MSKLEELRAAHAASTPGEWTTDFIGDDEVFHLYGGEKTATQIGVLQNWGGDHLCEGHEGSANANFITLARELMPALLEGIEALAEALPWLEAMLAEEPDDYDNYELRAVVEQARAALGHAP